jgi:hypothetical protein
MTRLGETVKRYDNSIFVYNLFVKAVNMANPSNEHRAKSLHIPLSDAQLYRHDLEYISERIPYLSVIKIVTDKGTQWNIDKMLEWLANKHGINPLFVSIVKEMFFSLLKQLNEQR